MKVLSSEWSDRIAHWMRTLKDDFYEPLGEISWEAARTMEQLPFDGLDKLNFQKVETGFTWGNEWEYSPFNSTDLSALTIP